jgi:predicted RNA-binding protein (virulence factor B family)|tara:strand:- start:39 stop:353 length:315 start_codon:yes stop_codon:yes gene_type:complete
MKISKTQLKQIIKEELSSIIREELQATLGEKIVSRPAALQEDGHVDVPSARRKLKTAMEDAGQILHALAHASDEDELPSWWMGKVTLASDYLNKARDYFLVSGD